MGGLYSVPQPYHHKALMTRPVCARTDDANYHGAQWSHCQILLGTLCSTWACHQLSGPVQLFWKCLQHLLLAASWCFCPGRVQSCGGGAAPAGSVCAPRSPLKPSPHKTSLSLEEHSCPVQGLSFCPASGPPHLPALPESPASLPPHSSSHPWLPKEPPKSNLTSLKGNGTLK